VFQTAVPKMLIWTNQSLRVTTYIKPSLLSIIFKYCHPKVVWSTLQILHVLGHNNFK